MDIKLKYSNYLNFYQKKKKKTEHNNGTYKQTLIWGFKIPYVDE